jgi:soluble lytic murein transglycosylase-like protein
MLWDLNWRYVMNVTEVIVRARHRYQGLLSSLHNGFAVLGFFALIAVFAFSFKVLPFNKGGPFSFGTIRYDVVVAPVSGDINGVNSDEGIRYRSLANYLARRYRVANDATEQLVGAAHIAGKRTGLDPLLILAVVAVESRFNPIAESDMGAKGLMQVIPQHHQDKLIQHGGDDAVLDPATNILIGARILKDYIRRSGSAEGGLQLYAGAASDSSSQYAQKVLAEKDRFAQVLRRDQQSARAAAIAAPPAL